ncbi:MAG: DUF5615 family PIN-like protein [Acidimicrobiales bacterium]
MRFKLDENLPYRAARMFVEAGHEADTVYDEDLAGQPDEVVLAAAISEDRVLVTLDLDFSDLRAYPIGTHCGIVVLRHSTTAERRRTRRSRRCSPPATSTAFAERWRS